MSAARVTVDRGAHLLLGQPRPEPPPRGEAAWTLLADLTWGGARNRVTRLVRMPLPAWRRP